MRKLKLTVTVSYIEEIIVNKNILRFLNFGDNGGSVWLLKIVEHFLRFPNNNDISDMALLKSHIDICKLISISQDFQIIMIFLTCPNFTGMLTFIY